MVWHYNSSETFHLDAGLWDKYSNLFSNVWGATAFKGATTTCQILPINKYHISNHEAWLANLAVYAGRILNFRGIALTGWSRYGQKCVIPIYLLDQQDVFFKRYDHYATLCELLPCSIPSLCLCMKTWLAGSYSAEIHWYVYFACRCYSDMSKFPVPWANFWVIPTMHFRAQKDRLDLWLPCHN